MSWARLDDNFHDHRKVVGLDVAAVGLYTLGLTWAHRNARHGGQQGIVPTGVAQRFAGAKTKRLAAALVTAGLWHEADGGWRIHDFEEYLPTAKTSEERAAAGRKGAAKRWARTPVDHAQDDGKLPSVSYGDDGKPMATDMANDGSRADARREVLRTSLPTPVPEPVLPTEEDRAPRRATAKTLIPGDFPLTPEMRAWASEHTPGVNPQLELDQFRDHWKSKGEKRADWDATWRTWMRNAQKWRGNDRDIPTTDRKVAAAQSLKGSFGPNQLAIGAS